MEDNNNNNPSSSRTDRKIIERDRRNQMKFLYTKLNSLVAHQSSREVTSLPDQLDEAARYIKSLQINLERMKEKKNSLMGVETNPNINQKRRSMVKVGLKSPQFEIHQKGSALEVVLITGLDCQFMFNETIRVLHEEGADIVNASYTVVQDTVFHSMHCQVGESADEATRISERLQKFACDSSAI